MAHDVATHIFQMARQQELGKEQALRASSRRTIRFEAHAVTVPVGDADALVCSARAPTITLHRADSNRWVVEYQGTSYDLSTFPQGVSFVLRCAVDCLLARLSDAMADQGMDDQDEACDIELCAYTRFGGQQQQFKPWTHTFGRLFSFPNTYEQTYEDSLQRYMLGVGKHVVAAAQAVRLQPAEGQAEV